MIQSLNWNNKEKHVINKVLILPLYVSKAERI